jgi:hypothetical protein
MWLYTREVLLSDPSRCTPHPHGVESNSAATLARFLLIVVDDPSQHAGHGDQPTSLWRGAVQATVHCLTGCAIGEVLGMVLATAFGWGNATSIAVSIVLAFFFGYALTIGPVLRAGVRFRRAVGVAFASDTVSITTMEIVDNVFILIVPGALAAGLGDALFWWSLAASLAIAFVVALPVNRWLIARGRGHAVMHEFHGH